MRNGLALAAVGCLSLTAAATADVLWEQLPDFNPDLSSFVDQAFADFPDFSTYMVSDVVLGSDSTINLIETFYTNTNLTWPQGGAGTATLNIFADPLTGASDPTAGTSVAVSYAVTADGIVMSASGLSIDLTAGTYWIGLTPELDFGAFGQEFHQPATAAFGAASQARNPGEGFGLGPDWFDAGFTFGGVENWDASIRIEGVPAPGALALLGIAGLVRRRRRK